MIRKIQEEYLEALKAGLWNIPLNGAGWSNADMSGVWKLAGQQRTRGLIASTIMSSMSGLSDKAYAKLRHFVFTLISSNEKMDKDIATIVKYLRDNGVESVLLKGQGVAQNYWNPLLRECGDIDLYVGKENFVKACRLMADLAGTEAEEKAIANDIHYHIRYSETNIEIHQFTHRIARKKQDEIYQSVSDAGLSKDLQSIQFEGIEIPLPSLDFNAFYIFHHFWYHFLYGGIGFRQICDWTMFLNEYSERLDLDKLRSTLENLGLMKGWKLFGRLAVDRLGLPAEKMPFLSAEMSAGKVDSLLEMVLEEGNFGTERAALKDRPRNFYVAKLRSMFHYVGRYWRIGRIVGWRIAFSQFLFMQKEGLKTIV